jgi:hypothetical protein
MKQFFLFLSISLCVNIYGTVRTVSNNPLNLAQYNNVQDAVNAAVSGDTIYVHGSPITYPSFTVTDKRLTLLGPGWAPDRGFYSYPAIIYDMTLHGVGTNNTEVQGLVFQIGITINNSDHPNNIRFIRNQFKSAVTLSSATPFSGYVFEGNWFNNGTMNCASTCEYYNIVFRNNIFYMNNINSSISGFYHVSNQNILFDHNLWYGPTGNGAIIFYNCRGLRFSNNIFVRRNAATNNTGSFFNNNITYNAGVNDPWAATYGNNDQGGNIADQNPQMFHQDSVNLGIGNPLLNFTIAGGPANNSGSDQKDMGLIYDASGALNWTNSRMSRIPYIYSMSITNPIVPAGGTLHVQVEARKSN